MEPLETPRPAFLPFQGSLRRATFSKDHFFWFPGQASLRHALAVRLGRPLPLTKIRQSMAPGVVDQIFAGLVGGHVALGVEDWVRLTAEGGDLVLLVVGR